MRGHEDILGNDAATAGAAQPDDVPVVLDRDIRDRDQEIAFIHRRARMVLNRAAEQQELRVLATGAKRPEAAEPVAAFHPFSGAARRDHRGNDGIGIGAIGILLRLPGEQPHQPGMGMDHAGAPPRRGAAARQGRDHVDMAAQRFFMAAKRSCLKHLEQAGRTHRSDTFIGQTAEAFPRPRRVRATPASAVRRAPPVRRGGIDPAMLAAVTGIAPSSLAASVQRKPLNSGAACTAPHPLQVRTPASAAKRSADLSIHVLRARSCRCPRPARCSSAPQPVQNHATPSRPAGCGL